MATEFVTPATALDQSTALSGQTVVVVGGGAGMGLAAARHTLHRGASVVLLARSAEKLAAAKASLLDTLPKAQQGDDVGRVRTAVLDATDDAAVTAYFDAITAGTIHHVVVTAGPSAGCGAFATDTLAAARKQFDIKFFLAWSVAHAASPKLADGGSITFTSGALSRRPGKGASALGACNAALETLTKALAHDLSERRVRVNCLSPGLARTSAFDASMSAEAQAGMFKGFGKAIPAGRAGEPDDLGHAIAFLVTNQWMTGAVLDCDGGAVIR